jgi:hypothetical protein
MVLSECLGLLLALFGASILVLILISGLNKE